MTAAFVNTIITSSTATTLNIPYPCGGDVESKESCQWREMHHLDDEGRHWCPTGFLYCHTHGGVGTITGPGSCQLWGEHPIETTGHIVRRKRHQDEKERRDRAHKHRGEVVEGSGVAIEPRHLPPADETDLTDEEVTAMWDEGTPTEVERGDQ